MIFKAFLVKTRLIVLFACLVLITLLVSVRLINKTKQLEATQTARYKRLTECTGHAPGNVHYHATLKISYLGEDYPIPANIGLIGDCIHPVHTHDYTGLIHVDYPTKYPFTLNDFFTEWGIRFSRYQLSNILITKDTRLVMTVNGHPSTEYENHIIHEGEVITLSVVKAD